MTTSKKAGFNPADHLMKLKGKDYLPVAWRLVWFRERYPNGNIDTEAIQLTDTTAVFRATITAIGEGGEVLGRATSHKSQSKHGFSDYIEKAETGAIGRALAALGFGTQFDPELDEGERLADSPVQRQNAPQKAAQAPQRNDKEPVDLMAQTVNAAGLKKLHAVLAEHDLTHDHLTAFAIDQGHTSSKELTNGQAKKLVDGLQDKPEAVVLYLTTLISQHELAQVGMEVGAQFDAQKAGK